MAARGRSEARVRTATALEELLQGRFTSAVVPSLQRRPVKSRTNITSRISPNPPLG